jgi:hypothetical protein
MSCARGPPSSSVPATSGRSPHICSVARCASRPSRGRVRISPARPTVGGTAFGGGRIATATVESLETWTIPLAQQTLVFLGAAARALDGHGTLTQVTGAPARRTNPERGLVSAGMAAVRALTHAAARLSRDALVRHEDVAHAVDFLATQSARGMTHELVVTPGGGRWIP